MSEEQQQQQVAEENNQGIHTFYGKTEEEYQKIISTPCEVLSYQRGTEEDKKISQSLEDFFANDFITKQQLKVKQQVLKELEEIIREWSDQISEERKIVKEMQHQYRARLLPFGSYCLGVSSKDGDIDLVIIAPHFVERETHFNNLLLNMFEQNPKVTKCKYVDAFNPIITFYYDEQAIDISLGKLDQEQVPEKIEKEIPDNFLRNIDKQDINALNGRRNNMDCLESVGNQRETYQALLKAIKMWYKAWGLGGNRLGYFGGIDVAILGAKICQLFPNLPLNRLLEEFFRIYSCWKWETTPVQIKPYNMDIVHVQKNWEMPLDLKMKPNMILISPSFPCINTSKATYYNQKVINMLINETNDLIQNEIKSKKKNWLSLFAPYRFFDHYNRFIEIDILGSQDAEIFEKWKDSCEVKMLKLFQSFAKGEQFFFHPYPKHFESVISKQQQLQNNEYKTFQTHFFIGVKKISNNNSNNQENNNNSTKDNNNSSKKTTKLNLKNNIREYYMRAVQKDLQLKQSMQIIDNLDNSFTVKIFQITLKELGDIDFGKIRPKILDEEFQKIQQQLENNNNSQNNNNQNTNNNSNEYDDEGYDNNYVMGENVDNSNNSQQQQSKQNNSNNKRKLNSKNNKDDLQTRKLVKKQSEYKPPSQTDLDAADDFL